MITARHKVLAHLKKSRACTAGDIARALKMSAPSVRHHLSVLLSDGRVELSGLRPAEGRGRPEKMYSLSQAALGDNMSALARALLIQAGSKFNASAVADHILDSSQFSGLAVTKRLVLLVERLNQMHYQARWEAGAQGPSVIFGRCPYADLIEDHPQLCGMDKALLERSLGRTVVQSARSEPIGRGLCPFIFHVG